MARLRIADLQTEHARWIYHNFPANTDDQAFLGMVEEIGEMAHILLKEQQKIRGYDDAEKAANEVKDCLGDLFVFMMSYCNTRAWDLEEIVTDTWEAVRQRDWVLYPDTGRPIVSGVDTPPSDDPS